MRRPRTQTKTSVPHGFALVAVLWLIAGTAVLVLAVTRGVRAGIAASSARTTEQVDEWALQGCLDAALATTAELVRVRNDAAMWEQLDTVLATDPSRPRDCVVSARPAGSRLPLNSASPQQVMRLACAAGVPAPRADSLASAIADWIDADGVTRPAGAERAWYVEHGEPPPPNRPVSTLAEVARIRGVAAEPDLLALVEAESGRILVPRAPDVVLAAAIGVSDSAIVRLRERVGRPLRVRDLLVLAAAPTDTSLRCGGWDPLPLSQLTDTPDAWTLTAHRAAALGSPQVRVEYRVRLVNGAPVVQRRRSWLP
ncbi:MAG: general secretion pathway protein GspK [Gemmatimonadetes bacterium]|nr:general secretion pathway protein GspK [Gemmatimonadota bacterium]